ncbi:unnamed protein product [Linum tenue]|uniref:Uncharacterized protein n=1 Tax=Linum tenue TaxID=586396 RepID=A0AAV0L0I7_9ROSI|nr:unnamed protein product [Linum tenue]
MQPLHAMVAKIRECGSLRRAINYGTVEPCAGRDFESNAWSPRETASNILALAKMWWSLLRIVVAMDVLRHSICRRRLLPPLRTQLLGSSTLSITRKDFSLFFPPNSFFITLKGFSSIVIFVVFPNHFFGFGVICRA